MDTINQLEQAVLAAAVYVHTGTRMRDLAARGRLCRGLRAVCTRHVIFTANRHGIRFTSKRS